MEFKDLSSFDSSQSESPRFFYKEQLFSLRNSHPSLELWLIMIVSSSCVCARLKVELPKCSVHLQSLLQTHLYKNEISLGGNPNHLAATESKKLGDSESKELPAG